MLQVNTAMQCLLRPRVIGVGHSSDTLHGAMHASDLRQQIDALGPRLSDADRRLASVLLADPTQTSYLSANEAARRAGIHPTSAVRFARKLGYENYSDLRSQLRAQLMRQEAEPATRVRQRLSRAAGGAVLSSLVQSEVRSLQALPAQVPAAALEGAARLLAKAPRILLCGTGHAAALVSLLEMRLKRSGYVAQGLDRTDWRTVEALAQLQKGDLLLAFVLRRCAKPMQQLLAEAVQRGLHTVLVSDLHAQPVTPSVLLAASRGAEGESQSLTVPMTICNALILELARVDEGASVRALERLAQARSALGRLG
jgi:DNA-binding MurR/RpiR family transcriptional regulator